jgi:predicted CxxxxCH...CXXCH cytochrome family protein
MTLNAASGSNVARGTGGDAGLTGCSGCHNAYDGTAAGQHSFDTVSRWGFETITDGPFSGCSACHGDLAVDTYWPDDTASTDLTSYPDRAGQHNNHVLRLGERLGYGSDPTAYTGTEQRTICGFCHDDLDSGSGGVGPSGHYPAGYTQADAPADVQNINQLWSPYNDDADDVYVAATYTGDTWSGGATCNTVDCHFNVTPQAWYQPSATAACNVCHSSSGTTLSGEDWAATGGHAEHDNDFDIGADCTICHTGYVPAAMANVTTTATHIDGDSATEVKVPDVAGVYLAQSGTNTGYAAESCTAVSCHGGQGTPVWSTGAIDVATECNLCHVAETTQTEYNSAVTTAR